MKILVLGGTVFLSRAVAVEAVARGHDVLCAARGVSGSPPHGASLVRWDRNDPVPVELTRQAPDAVVDVSRTPSHVRRAVAAFGDAHWTFVSTINVYSDVTTPGGTPATLPLHEAIETDEDPASGPEVYGAMKVACENAVRAGVPASLVLRPGLIAGPGDPSGRFTYWPARFAEAAADGGPVLVPEPVDALVQLIDVRDLARWIVDGAETGSTGVLDAIGRPVPRSEVLSQVAAGVEASPDLVRVGTETLTAHGVAPWSGDRSLPLWIDDPDWAGLLAHDVTASYDAGLRTRPVSETARDTLTWLRSTPDATVTGLTRAEELDLLRTVG
ncbi:NAD-dependent epimerase/dehydratase family protein [Myceligenerans indicum]|uniref:NAD-dependent epimerase/dehydratase family protein n=1 Tax=Myceligenerans indicum TaxID=2593663 RepID=A0ABS1LF01_9MICO|nr:NAD-dependent epimerase/dehydratase family protein [Myceligenerans indicum]MBL0884779.1 NAD-dependent epimerase/dehydratase family protein [Myceligenerans indicum]